jgi:hypothetical protein
LWHNIKDLPQLLISNFLIKTPSSIFTCAVTSYSLTEHHPPTTKMSINSMSPPTACTHKFLPTQYNFSFRLWNSISHTRTHAHTHTHTPKSIVLEAKDERMNDQSNQVHSFTRIFSHNKQTEIVQTHKAHIRLQVERSN